MEEQLISFETAKLVKEKGFDWKCNYYYETSRQLICFGGSEHSYTSIDNTLWSNMYLLAPTQSLLQKWLREVHKINVYCIPSDFEEGAWYNSIASHNPVFTGTYEEALEVGLEEALKLISYDT